MKTTTRTFFKSLAVATAVMVLSTSNSIVSAAEDDQFAQVQVTAQQVAANIHMLKGAGGNIGVSIGGDGTLIIDDQFGPLAEKILAAINSIDGAKPTYVLNTHFHGDHTGSNAFFGASGTIIAHNNVRVRLLGEQAPATALPVITFNDQVNLYFNSEEITITHLPHGHTDGDSFVWFKKANVAHLGDHFFNGRFPYIDIGNGGSVEGFIRNLETVISTLPGDTAIIPGHGELGSIADVAQSLRVIRTTNNAVVEKLKQGQDTTAIATAGFGDELATWGTGFINTERWVQILEANWQQNKGTN